jgi:AcrR family transcriptional regulator
MDEATPEAVPVAAPEATPAATPRQKLLAAVVTVALTGGISDKSLRAIAVAAGTSHRMLIHHFGSRERLLVDVIREVEERQRTVLAEMVADPGDPGDPDEEPAAREMRMWQHLRSPELAPQERLFFEVYGQALQGRAWARPLLDGIVENWLGPVAGMLEAAGIDPETARTAARLWVAVGRGLLLDVLATGDNDEVDATMRFFADMMLATLQARLGESPAKNQ